MLAKGGSRRERKGGGIVELDLERRFNEPTAALISAGEVFRGGLYERFQFLSRVWTRRRKMMAVREKKGKQRKRRTEGEEEGRRRGEERAEGREIFVWATSLSCSPLTSRPQTLKVRKLDPLYASRTTPYQAETHAFF